MPYRPHLPPPITESVDSPAPYAGPPMREKPVTAVTRVLRMTLKEFEQGARIAQIRVPWLPETLWFVSGEEQVETLIRRGICRGRIWTARELMFLWSVPSLDQKAVEKLACIKAQIGGDIISVERPRGRSRRQ